MSEFALLFVLVLGNDASYSIPQSWFANEHVWTSRSDLNEADNDTYFVRNSDNEYTRSLRQFRPPYHSNIQPLAGSNTANSNGLLKYQTMMTGRKDAEMCNFVADCIKCVCMTGQIALCTAVKCEIIGRPLIIPKRVRECRDGDGKMDDCNRCFCSGGIWYCTKVGCSGWSAHDRPTGQLQTPKKPSFPSPYTGSAKYKERMDACKAVGGPKEKKKKMSSANNDLGDNQKSEEIVYAIPYDNNTKYRPSKDIEVIYVPEYDDCNVCHCLDGELYCTDTNCRAKQPDQSIKPSCIHGRDVPSLDGCNKCICYYSHIMCTKYDCGPYNNGLPKNVPSRCKDGQKIPPPDSCNHCTCWGGRVLCTMMQCKKNIYDVKLTKQIRNVVKHVQPKRVRCKHGEEIIYDECNYCVCVKGQVMCIRKDCINPMGKKALLYSYEYSEHSNVIECQGDEVVPADDGCNECHCFNGIFLCTKYSCDYANVVNVPCTKGTWFSPVDDVYCRECYCLDTNFSFCYLNFCLVEETNKKQLTENDKIYVEPVCLQGESFMQGTLGSCRGCSCKEGRWQCWDYKKACPNSRSCPEGTIIINKNTKCSICYCDLNGNVCSFDLKCAEKLRSG